ncbi:MAG TPA: phosphoribosylformylglycinamidine synthase subunit PurL [Bdellovibrionota bacterium]|nr:phosphoribosylformylglycinamidine synthase subunit PurL [Bdellovibrionota bacterium]
MGEPFSNQFYEKEEVIATTLNTKELGRKLGLSEEEYASIVKHLGRSPTQLEVSLFSAMWSEHCSYKSSRAILKNFPTKAPHVLQGPGENAGIIDIGDGLAICFKIESHNHPSFLEPYQGAATGVGGILRDIFTMGARPIASLNLLRFGNPDNPKIRYLVGGVVSGIGGYGNCIGVPTVGTNVFFHPSYELNPLVNAFTLGVVKKENIFLGRASGAGNSIVYVGGETGRDGIGGAIMASAEFDDEAYEKKPTVQVGDPFMEKLLLEACLEAMQQDYVIGIQDMGAAGLTCATFEIADRGGVGIKLNLSAVPLRAEGMTPAEIMMSESQERMLLCIKKGYEEDIKKLFSKWDLEAAVVGEVIDSPYIKIEWEGQEIGEIPVAPLVSGAPMYNRPAHAPQYYLESKSKTFANHLRVTQEDARDILNSINLSSRRWVMEQYDSMVGANTVSGYFDVPLIRVKENNSQLAFALESAERVSFCDPYQGGVLTILNAARALACVGAKPLGISDCLNFGNPQDPEIMWQFEQSVLGMSRAARAFDVPVISGNVSLYNETKGEAILPTPVVTMVGIVRAEEKVCESVFQKEGDLIYLLGRHEPTLVGSEFQSLILGKEEGSILSIDLSLRRREMETVRQLVQEGLLQSACNICLGGLFQALVQSCSKGLGAYIQKLDVAHLYGEVDTGFLVSISLQNKRQFEKYVYEKGVNLENIGEVCAQDLKIGDAISFSVAEIMTVREKNLPELFNG